MSDKKEAILSVSEQINRVIDNISDKVDAPAGAMRDMVTYGFEAYTEYVWATGLSYVLISAMVLMAALLAVRFALNIDSDYMYNKYRYSTDDVLNVKGVYIAVSIIVAIICLIIIANYLPDIVSPEGAAIREIKNRINP